jgi:hypothetical protein
MPRCGETGRLRRCFARGLSVGASELTTVEVACLCAGWLVGGLQLLKARHKGESAILTSIGAVRTVSGGSVCL